MIIYLLPEKQTRESARKMAKEKGGKVADFGKGETPRWKVAVDSEEKEPIVLEESPTQSCGVEDEDVVVIIQGNMLNIDFGDEDFNVFSSDEIFPAVMSAVANLDYLTAYNIIKEAEEEAKNKEIVLADNLVLSGGKLYYYGSEMQQSIANKICEDHKNGCLDDRYVKFLVKLLHNPASHSVDEMYDFIEANNLNILPDGNIECFKGVSNVPPQSNVNGYEWVDWRTHNIPNYKGMTIKMPRNLVDDDPKNSCSFGLHVGNAEYSSNYGYVLTCSVDPANIVSVPYDYNCLKCRTCEYTIIDGPAEKPNNVPRVVIVNQFGAIISTED